MSSLSVTTIQVNLSWEDKETNLAQFAEKIISLRGKTEVVVLPEMFSTGFSMKPEVLAEPMTGKTISWLKNLSKENNLVLIGSLMIEDEGNYYNRLLCVLPNGTIGHYDKRHLFSYAGEEKYFSAGSRRLIASVKGWKLCLQVCYDLRFPVWARQQQKDNTPEYDALIYVANWPEKRKHAWKTLLTARAIENQCYVVGVNRVGNDGHDIPHSGDTMVIDALGKTLYHCEGKEDTHTVVLQKDELNTVRERFPFWKDGDGFDIKL